jgi:subtilisin-like proprotein convertase family protein
MWVYNSDYKKWQRKNDSLLRSDYEWLKQELSATRFYSKFLSGSTYVPVTIEDDIYDIVGKWKPRSWFVSSLGSIHSESSEPVRFATPINSTTSYDYYTRFNHEYGLTLKNHFTPKRIIRDALKNMQRVDVATTNVIDVNGVYSKLTIDGVVVKPGQKVLVKDQVTLESLDSSFVPDDYFVSNYTVTRTLPGIVEYSYYNSQNGIYTFDGSRLIKDDVFDVYERCVRFSVVVNMGDTNVGKQFHLSRLLSGYFPTSSLSEPMEFKERKNWIMRHRVDYNNLFDINYYDAIKHPASSYYDAGVTYSIPERSVAVGEFGVIMNTQNGISTIVPNKHKVNLRGISMTTRYYWICGDDSTLLRVEKNSFYIKRIKIDSLTTLRSVSFFNDLRGVVVGDLNTILLTLDGGQSWKRLKIDDFAAYTYNKVVFAEYNTIFIVGRAGVFIEIEESPAGWTAYKRRISKQIDDDDEYLLVDNINDLVYTRIDTWSLSYNYVSGTIAPDKRVVMMVTDGGGLIVYDIDSSSKFDFIYLEFPVDYGDIVNVTRRAGTDEFFFTNNDGLYHFDINIFSSLGVGNVFSNTSKSTATASFAYGYFANEIYDYQGGGLLIAGNNSLYRFGTYSFSTGGTMSAIDTPDPNFESRLRSKLLFLDYDMAGKLNFFTDDGQYRLPNKVTFDVAKTGGYRVSATASLMVPVGTAPKFYLDGKNITSSIKLVNSPTLPLIGNVKEVRVIVSITCPNMSMVSIALRKNDNPNAGKVYSILKYGQASMVANMTNFTFTSDESFEEIYNVAPPYTDKTVKMDLTPPKFVVYNSYNTTITSNDLSEALSISGGREQATGEWQLIVMNYGTEITNPIILNDWKIEFLMERSYLNIGARSNETNWLTYNADSQKTFTYWSGLVPSDNSNVMMSYTFSSYASYSTFYPYELVINGVNTDLGDILKLAPGITYSDQQSLSATFSSRYYNNQLSPISVSTNPPTDYGKIPLVYAWNYLLVLETDLNWKVEIGDMLSLKSDIIDANLLVNRIESYQNRRFIYTFSNFNESIINGLKSSKFSIRNLNKYLAIENFASSVQDHPISDAYEISYSEDNKQLSIGAKFNNKTAYYNLAATVNYSGKTESMVYQDSFLKFGYSPTYNILDYLVSINRSAINPVFYGDKEYLALPIYTDLTIAANWTTSTMFIDSTGFTYSKYTNDPGNKIVFGSDLALEWESIMLNTFVDVHIYQPAVGSTFSVDRLLVIDKYKVQNYENSGLTALIVEFHDRINFSVKNSMTGAKIQIRSRRKLSQISRDLMEMNNIQRPKSKVSTTKTGASYSSYDRSLNAKIPTDSYAKVLLSDADTVKELSGIFYFDYKNELAMNITRLDKSYNIPISNTANYNGKLFITCDQKHELQVGDGVVLDFNGGTFSSQYLNQQYFGFQSVLQVVNDYEVVINTDYGNQVYVGNDTGFIKYLKKDPFLNYEPVDIIEVGADRKGNIAIQLKPDNVMLVGATFSLSNVDWNRYRYRLVDGLTVDNVANNYAWLLDAEISDAVIGVDGDGLRWYKGIWESGRWFGGKWFSGTWKYGDWYDGEWYSKNVTEKGLSVIVDENTSDDSKSVWFTGRWYEGTWNGGTWANGRWYDGTFENGVWNNGIWNDGVWNLGRFIGGIWVLGTWNDGVFNTDNEPAFWIDGTWNGGDFENGIWYNGIFSGDKSLSRFGTKAYNSRTAIWYGGKWKSGSFHSYLDGVPAVSETHKYSVWYSGQWLSGDFYGGVAYNMQFSSGTWHGGILEDIQVIGMNSKNNSFILNGIFRFNLGDEIFVVDNNNGGEYSKFGTNKDPIRYTVLDTVLDESARITEVYLASDIDTTDISSYKKSSGILNLQIPNNSSYITNTQFVSYEIDKTNEIRVKINLVNQNIGDLTINLKSPNGEVINIKQYGVGGVSSEPTYDIVTPWKPNPNTKFVDSVFTTNDAGRINDSGSPYSGVFQMDKTLGVGSGAYISTSLDYQSLTDSQNGVKGNWTLYIKDENKDIITTHNNSTVVGINHSAGNSVTVRYNEIGDRLDVTILGSEIWAKNIRKGDVVSLDLLRNDGSFAITNIDNSGLPKEHTLDTFVEEVYGNGSPPYTNQKPLGVAPFVTKIRLSATASATIESTFIGPANDPAFGKPRYCFGNIRIKSNPNPENKLIDWEIQFVNDSDVGAQIGYTRSNGFDTGLRVVSRFRNANWKTGIWTNGLFDSGLFEGGIWYNGVFKGTWG